MFGDVNMHSYRMGSMRLTIHLWNSAGPGCRDKCLTTCPEFRLKIEVFETNITKVCTEFHKDKAKTAPPVSKKAVTTQTSIILEEEEQFTTPTITKIGPCTIKKIGTQRLLTNPEWSLKLVEMGMQLNASDIWLECAQFLRTSFMD